MRVPSFGRSMICGRRTTPGRMIPHHSIMTLRIGTHGLQCSTFLVFSSYVTERANLINTPCLCPDLHCRSIGGRIRDHQFFDGSAQCHTINLGSLCLEGVVCSTASVYVSGWHPIPEARSRYALIPVALSATFLTSSHREYVEAVFSRSCLL